MDPRNYLSGAGATPPAAPGSPSNGYPQSAVPGVSPATKPGPFWYYKIGESLRNIITGAGLTPSDTDLAQLEEALRRHAGAHVSLINSNTTLGPQHAGLVLVDATSGNVTITLPAAATLAALGYEFRRTDTSASTVTIQRAGADTIESVTSIALVVRGRVRLVADGVSAWHRTTLQIATAAEAQAFTQEKLLDGAMLAAALQGGNQSLAASGYQKLPGGVIFQWGTTGAISSAVGVVQTFPIAFPSECLKVMMTLRGSPTQNYTGSVVSKTTTGFTAWNYSTGGAGSYEWFAVGK
ncbi:MAG: hypothetical protein AB1450_08275 [Pseudomonadota bacterium]